VEAAGEVIEVNGAAGVCRDKYRQDGHGSYSDKGRGRRPSQLTPVLSSYLCYAEAATFLAAHVYRHTIDRSAARLSGEVRGACGAAAALGRAASRSQDTRLDRDARRRARKNSRWRRHRADHLVPNARESFRDAVRRIKQTSRADVFRPRRGDFSKTAPILRLQLPGSARILVIGFNPAASGLPYQSRV